MHKLVRLIALLIGSSGVAYVQASNWLQFGYDQASSSNNNAENGYSTAAGNILAYSASLSSGSDSTPIYLSNVVTPSGTKDLLFIVAQDGTLLALDAADGSAVWSKQPTGGGSLTTGAPVIDPSLLYVYAYGLDGSVHKYQVADGVEITAGWPQVSTLKPDVEKGASGLSIASPSTGGNFLYSVTNGYVGDAGDYQGHVTAINLATGTQNVFNSQCSNLLMHLIENGTSQVNDCDLEGQNQSYVDGEMSGIWGRPGAIFDTATNRIYVATGNGVFDANETSGNHFEWGDSVLALNLDGTGAGGGLPKDSYTPSTYVTLYDDDTDLGSTSPAILPSSSTKYPHLAVQSGKDGCVRLIDLDKMGGVVGPGHVGMELNAASSCSTDAVGNEVRTQPAVWTNPADKTTWFYITTDGGMFGFHLTFDGSGNPSLTQPLTTALSTLPGGTSPVIANGELYYVTNNSPYVLYAVSASTGAVIWQSTASINNIHWQSPIVVNGRLFLVDGNATLWVHILDGIFKDGFQ